MSRTKTWRGKGRGGGFRGRGGGARGRGGGARDDRWSNPRSDIPRKNELLEEYYNEIGIISAEEKAQFWEKLREDLPNSFRFAGSRGHALTVQRRLIDHYIPEITAVEYDGKLVSPPKPVDWFPDQLAWTMDTSKNIIRRFAPFASFQKFLVSESNVGNITRQEIVSMIPPLVMDVKPGMTVLDLCAAPGSKSAQLIEMIHGGEEARVRKVLEDITCELGQDLSPRGSEVVDEMEKISHEDDWSDDGRSTGLLIANDVDYKRAQMLIHQCKRLNSPNLIIVNHDATLFPSIKIPSASGNAYLKFDRILADVPCSGDGTTRKNPEIWKEWAPAKALGLHLTQVRILIRALCMLKTGGRVVYSTCSMNPIEDEAVVATAIERCGGTAKVKLIPQDHALPGLKRRPGIDTWKVMDKSGEWWDTYKQMTRTSEEKGLVLPSKIVEGMFPPSADEHIPLKHCMRIYPHLQDTGGFFIAVLEKQSEIRPRAENTPKTLPTPQVPVDKLLDELNARAAESDQDRRLETLDGLEPDLAVEVLNPSAAQRQNEAIAPSTNGEYKRAYEDDGPTDPAQVPKRLKSRNDISLAPAPSDEAERMVHFPPPPGAKLEETAHRHSSPAPQQQRNTNKNSTPEEAFKYLDPCHEELRSIRSFYSLNPRFPTDRFMVRNPSGAPVKSIYYTSALAKAILEENEGKGIKFMHCGVTMFVKQDVSNAPDACKWRIQSEGLGILEGWVGAGRVVRLWRRATLRKLLVEMFPKVADGGWTELGEVGEQVKDLGLGCCVLRVEPIAGHAAEEKGEEGFAESFVMPLWRGAGSLNLMLPKEERKAMLLRLYNDDSPLVDHMAIEMAERRNKAKAEEEKEQKSKSKDAETEEAAALAALSEMSEGEDAETGGVKLDAEAGVCVNEGDGEVNV